MLRAVRYLSNQIEVRGSFRSRFVVRIHFGVYTDPKTHVLKKLRNTHGLCIKNEHFAPKSHAILTHRLFFAPIGLVVSFVT